MDAAGRHATVGLPATYGGAIVGRERELARLLALVDDDEQRLITVTGRGGVGKSRLALEAAAVVAASDLRDVVWVPLRSIRDPEAVPDELAGALGVRTNGAGATDALARRLQRSATLLVLDDAEHLVAAGPAVSELVGRCPRLTVVVTSQTRLGLADERVLELAPLPVPEDDVSRSPAVDLYLARAAAVADRPDDHLAAVADLCRRLEGLPLAIELAAARAGTLRAADVVARLDEAPLDTLRRGPRDALGRHPDLRTAIAWTVGLLADEERALLYRLAAVPDPFDLDVAMAVHGDRSGAEVVDAVSALVDFHLADPLGDGWFTIPSSIRAYAVHRLDADEGAEAVARFVRWCATRGPRAGDRAEPVLRAGLRLALERGHASEAHRVLDRLGPIWRRTVQRHEHHDLIAATLALPAADVPPAVRARALVWSAALAPPVATGADRDQLARRIGEAERVARMEKDDVLLLLAVSARILASASLGPIEDFSAVLAEARTVAERLGDPRWIARCDLWASMDAQQRGDLEGSIRHARAALLAARELRDDALLAHAASLLVPVRHLRKELVAEVPTLEEMVEPVRRARLIDLEGYLLPMLVDDAVAAGSIAAARRWCTEGLELAADAPAAAMAIPNLLVAAYIAQAAGDDAMAARLYGTLQRSISGFLKTLQPFRRARHDDAVGRLRRTLGPRFDDLARAGAALSRGEAIEEALAFLARDPQTGARRPRPATTRLTRRERDVLRLLADGMTNKEIGARLSLTPKTVMHHTSAIYRKLGVRGRSEAAVWAIHNDRASV